MRGEAPAVASVSQLGAASPVGWYAHHQGGQPTRISHSSRHASPTYPNTYRSAKTSDQRETIAKHVVASSAWAALSGEQPAAHTLLDGLFSMAATTGPGWAAALALLGHRG